MNEVKVGMHVFDEKNEMVTYQLVFINWDWDEEDGTAVLEDPFFNVRRKVRVSTIRKARVSEHGVPFV